LLALSKNKISLPKFQSKYCVFLDQMLATHCDFGKTISTSPVTAEKYFSSLKRFFNLIEAKLGMPVIIAASPRANYDTTPEIFGHRSIIQDETLELVANSDLVLIHSSTAVSFAILYDKPILVIKTNEMDKAPGYANFLNKMAQALGLTPLCIDDLNVMNTFKFEQYKNWPRDYANYKFKYIKSRHAKNKITWEVVIENFLNPINQL
jgi:hypothetical protein